MTGLVITVLTAALALVVVGAVVPGLFVLAVVGLPLLAVAGAWALTLSQPRSRPRSHG